MGRRARIARRLRSEQGYSLIELLVAMTAALVICAAAVTFMTVTFDQGDQVSGRALAASRAETGLERLVQDLRDSMTGVSLATSGSTTTLSLSIPKPNTQTTGGDTGETVSWSCTASSTTTAGVCQRTLQGGSAVTEIRGVSSIAFTPVYSGATTTTNATDIASMGIVLKVVPVSQINPGRSIQGSVGGGTATISSNPITINTTADLRNFG